jgi:hypothetical protein
MCPRDLLQRTLHLSKSLDIARHQIIFCLENVEPLRVILVLLHSRVGAALDIGLLSFCGIRRLTQLILKLRELPPLPIELRRIEKCLLIAHCCLQKTSGRLKNRAMALDWMGTQGTR